VWPQGTRDCFVHLLKKKATMKTSNDNDP
jgi:hypothetical protein